MADPTGQCSMYLRASMKKLEGSLAVWEECSMASCQLPSLWFTRKQWKDENVDPPLRTKENLSPSARCWRFWNVAGAAWTQPCSKGADEHRVVDVVCLSDSGPQGQVQQPSLRVTGGLRPTVLKTIQPRGCLLEVACRFLLCKYMGFEFIGSTMFGSQGTENNVEKPARRSVGVVKDTRVLTIAVRRVLENTAELHGDKFGGLRLALLVAL